MAGDLAATHPHADDVRPTTARRDDGQPWPPPSWSDPAARSRSGPLTALGALDAGTARVQLAIPTFENPPVRARETQVAGPADQRVVRLDHDKRVGALAGEGHLGVVVCSSLVAGPDTASVDVCKYPTRTGVRAAWAVLRAWLKREKSAVLVAERGDGVVPHTHRVPGRGPAQSESRIGGLQKVAWMAAVVVGSGCGCRRAGTATTASWQGYLWRKRKSRNAATDVTVEQTECWLSARLSNVGCVAGL